MVAGGVDVGVAEDVGDEREVATVLADEACCDGVAQRARTPRSPARFRRFVRATQASPAWFTIAPRGPLEPGGPLVDGGQVARGGRDVLVAEELLEAAERPAAEQVAERISVPRCVRARAVGVRPDRRRARWPQRQGGRRPAGRYARRSGAAARPAAPGDGPSMRAPTPWGARGAAAPARPCGRWRAPARSAAGRPCRARARSTLDVATGERGAIGRAGTRGDQVGALGDGELGAQPSTRRTARACAVRSGSSVQAAPAARSINRGCGSCSACGACWPASRGDSTALSATTSSADRAPVLAAHAANARARRSATGWWRARAGGRPSRRAGDDALRTDHSVVAQQGPYRGAVGASRRRRGDRLRPPLDRRDRMRRRARDVDDVDDGQLHRGHAAPDWSGSSRLAR
jgi:hypothetical protein